MDEKMDFWQKTHYGFQSKNGAQARIILNDDLKLAEWETVLPQAAA